MTHVSANQRASTLVVMSKAIHEEPLPKAKRIARELDSLIDDCILTRQGAILDRALAAVQSEELADDLRRRIYGRVEKRYFRAGKQPAMMCLFVVPIVTCTPTGALTPFAGDEKSHAAVARIVESFRQFRLVRKEATIVVNPYAYHPDELGVLDLTSVARLGISILSKASGSTAVTQEDCAEFGWPSRTYLEPTVLDAGPLELRYLVGAVIDAPSKVEGLFEPRRATPEHMDRYGARLQKWQRAVMQPVCDILNSDPTGTLVCLPAMYFAGMYRGLVQMYGTQAHARVTKAFAEMGMSPKAAWALLACYGSGDRAESLRVTVASKLDNGFVTGLEWPIFEHLSYDENIEMIHEELASMGIDRLELFPQPQVGDGFVAPPQLAMYRPGLLH